jgi:branched-chain amino acid transport system permease protein
MLADWVNTILQGVLLGGLYALFAAGLSISFGVMRMINIAHGDMIIFASYATIVGASYLKLPMVLTVVLVTLVLSGMGYAAQRQVFNRTLGSDLLRPLLLTFGLSIVIRESLQAAFSADVRSVDVGPLATATWNLGAQINVGALPLTVMLIGLVSIAALQWLFANTRMGRSFRATSDDADTASLMGVNRKHVYALAMVFGSAMVALAGAFLVMRTTVSPSDGPIRLIYAFEAVIIGGLGSLWGTVAGGVVLGVAQAIGARLDPGWGTLAGHLAFLAILWARPQGLFPTTKDR